MNIMKMLITASSGYYHTMIQSPKKNSTATLRVALCGRSLCRCNFSKNDGYVCRLGATGRTIRLATECLDLCCVCVGLHGLPTSFLSLSPSLLYPFAGVEQPIIVGQHL